MNSSSTSIHKYSSNNAFSDLVANKNTPEHPGSKSDPTKNPTTFNIICMIIWNGCIGGTTFMASVTFLVIQIIYTGHLPNSNLFLSAIISAFLWAFVGSSLICGFNSGLPICVGRCIALGDFHGIRLFFKMSMNSAYIMTAIYTTYGIIMYFVVGTIYGGDDTLLYWIHRA